MSKYYRLICYSILLLFFNSNLLAAKPYISFEGPEHITLGDEVNLHLASGEIAQKNYQLHLPNQLSLSYGEIVSFGDFYEIPNVAISLGKTATERAKFFRDAFESLAYSKKAVPEAYRLLAVLHQTKNRIDDAIARGEDPEKVYREMSEDTNRQFNCITGGGCEPDTWFLQPGRYLELANTDFDHFGAHAWLAYETGHQVALEQALIARQNKDAAGLEIAYAMNAFACHFLSDRFAAGHLRTPRVSLYTKVTPATVGSLLSNYMHTEENLHGLHVRNLRGDYWISYGDRAYLSQKNVTNRTILHAALQQSANEIYEAYQMGNLPLRDVVETLIPHPLELYDQAKSDVSTLFYWDQGKQQLMRRSDVTNIYDKHWTADWWGWSTLALLSKEKGLPQYAQLQLMQANPELAVESGLITDKIILKQLSK